MKTLWLALASISISVLAQFMLKAGMSSMATKAAGNQRLDSSTLLAVLGEPYVVVGFALYGLGAVVWLSVLSEWEVSKAYPLVGTGFALSAAVGFLFGEQISLLRAVGICLICAGVWVVART